MKGKRLRLLAVALLLGAGIFLATVLGRRPHEPRETGTPSQTEPLPQPSQESALMAQADLAEEEGPSPSIDDEGEGTPERATPPPGFEGLGDSEIALQIRRHLTLGMTFPDPRHPEYQRSLDELRAEAPSVLGEVSRLYAQSPEEKYVQRWALVQVARELRVPESAPLLRTVLTSEIPKEKFPGDHLRSSVAEELTIRLAAIYGLEELAKSGDAPSRGTLLDLAQTSPHRAVRVEAALAYLDQADELTKARAELGRHLRPEERESILGIQRLGWADPMPGGGGK